MTRSNRRKLRGQATVELALGLLVFVTVLVFGIHFAEVSYMSMRVQQSAHYALMNTTGHQTHQRVDDPNIPSGGRSWISTIPGRTTNLTQQRFDDFDAVRTGTTNSVQQVLTQIRNLDVTCTVDPSIGYLPNGEGLEMISEVFWDEGGVRCGAQATIGIYNFPRNFFDGNWNFSNRNYAAAQENYRICATPRSANGQCGQFPVLLGDWSLQSAAESDSHDLFRGGNEAFANVVEKAFDLQGGGGTCPAAAALMEAVAGSAPADACSFAFSYQGVPGYVQDIRGAAVGPGNGWNTSGVPLGLTRALNNETFLGVPASRRF